MAIMNQQQLEKLLNLTTDSLILADKEFNIVYATQSARELLSVKDESTNYPLENYINTELLPSTKSVNVSTTLKSSESPVDLTIIPDDDNYLIRMTERYNDKSAIIASLSHDLKNPLHCLTGFTQALLDGIIGDLNEKQAKYIAIVNKNANILLRMIFNFTDLTKYDVNKLGTSPELFTIKSAMNQVIREIQEIADAKHVEIVVDYDAIETDHLYTDRAKLTQLTTNFIELMVSHVTNDTITIAATKNDNEELDLRIDLVDQALPAEELAFLFSDKPLRIPKEAKLGINAVRVLVAQVYTDMLNGTLVALSDQDGIRGFHVTLPVKSKDRVIM